VSATPASPSAPAASSLLTRVARSFVARALFTFVALTIWFWTQSLIGARALPAPGLGDGLLSATASLNQYLHLHPAAANALLIASSAIIDLLGIYLLGAWLFRGSPRPFIALLLVLDKLFAFSAVMALLTPVMLVGGMTLGVFTPTEGAIAASMWALFLGLIWYRTLDWRHLIKLTMDTIETTAAVLFIVAAASIFGWLLTVTHVTDAVAEWVLGFTHNPNVFLLLANVLLLFVGCFLEPTAAITLLVPILVPICSFAAAFAGSVRSMPLK